MTCGMKRELSGQPRMSSSHATCELVGLGESYLTPCSVSTQGHVLYASQTCKTGGVFGEPVNMAPPRGRRWVKAGRNPASSAG